MTRFVAHGAMLAALGLAVPSTAQTKSPLATSQATTQVATTQPVLPGEALPFVPSAVAIDRGRLLLADRDGKQLATFDAAAGPESALLRSLPGAPTAICPALVDGKRGWLVLLAAESTLLLLDEKLEQRLTIDLPGRDGTSVAAAADVPLAVVSVRRADGAMAGPLMIDLGGTGRVVGGNVNLGAETSTAFSLSADGTFLYGKPSLDPRAKTSIWRLTRGVTFAASPTRQLGSSSPSCLPMPWLGAVMQGRYVFSADGTSQLKQFESTGDSTFAIGAHPARPLLFLQTSRNVLAVDTNDWRVSKEIEFPLTRHHLIRAWAEAGFSYEQMPRFPETPTVLLDAEADNLVSILTDRIVVTPLASLQLEERPMLGLRVDVPESATVGKPLALPVLRANPTSIVTIAQGPKAMTFDGEALRWTPSATDIGLATVVLRVADRASGASREQAVPILVSHRVTGLPFAPERLALTPAGKHAVLFGRPEAYRNRQDAEQGKSRIAVVDLDTGTFLADRTLPDDVTAIAAGDEAVYVASGAAPVIQAFSLKTLEPGPKVPADAVVKQMCVSNGALFTYQDRAIDGTSSPYVRYDLPALTTARIAAGTASPNASAVLPQTLLTGGKVLADGVVWADTTIKRAEMITDPRPTTIVAGNSMLRGADPLDPQRSFPFGLRVRRGQVVRDDGAAVMQIDGNTGDASITLLADPPVVAFARTKGIVTRDSTDGPMTFTIEVRDLARGNLARSIPLAPIQASPVPADYFPQMQATEDGSRVVCVGWRRLFVVDAADLKLEGAVAPLHLMPRQSELILKPQGKTTVHLSPAGGKPPYRFEIAGEPIPGVTIDATTGDVTFDADVLRPIAEERLMRVITGAWLDSADLRERARPGGEPPKPPVPATLVATFARRDAARFTAIAGRPPAGVPAAVVVHWGVTDAAGTSMRQNFAVLLDVPRDAIVARIEKTFAENEEKRRQFEEKRRAGANEAAASRRRESDLAKRNAELEAEVARLRAELAGQKPATSQPAKR